MRWQKIGEELFRWGVLLILLLLFLMQSYCVEAAERTGAPPELAQWQDWVLWRQPDADCPFIAGAALPLPRSSTEAKTAPEPASSRVCAWPETLSLHLAAQQLKFSQYWQLYGESWVALPGDSRYWPQQVRINGKAAEVIARRGRPMVRLTAGSYLVEGAIPYTERPRALTLPPYTGALALHQDGKRRFNLAFDRQGKLLLGASEKPQPKKQADRLEVKVFRKLSDGYPMRLETRLQLAVSGQERRARLGRLLPEGFVPVALESSQPARVRPDGLVDLQLRPGQQTLRLEARALAPITQFAMDAVTEDWPDQELLAFAPEPAYRVLALSGARSIDPSQTLLPQPWRQLSSYLLTENSVLNIEQRQRGEQAPPSHRLSLKRELWLSFDGRELTSREQLSGEIGHLDRLTSAAGYAPGTLEINGRPQLITELDGQPGVEVRPGNIELTSVGLQHLKGWPVNPWQTDLERAQLTLQLPPGYRLFYASGVDYARGAYLSSWNLWSIFIGTLLVVLLFRLFSWHAALIGALYVLLMHGVAGAPSPIWWLLLLGCWAGRRYLPAGRLRSISSFCYRGLGLVLALLFIGFAVDQARQAFYPQLERPWVKMGQEAPRASRPAPAAPVESLAMEAESLREEVQAKGGVLLDRAVSPSPGQAAYSYRYDADSVIQTGPGLPSWRWRALRLGWSGPVAAGQQVSLYLMPPALNRSLNIIRILLFLGLAAYLAGIKREQLHFAKQALPLLLVGLIGLGTAPRLDAAEAEHVPAAQEQSWPTPELLQEYRQRLLAPPLCAPECGAMHRAELRLGQERIELGLKFSQAAFTSLALPLTEQLQGALIRIELDGRRVPLRRLGKTLQIPVTEGNHRLLLELAVAELDQLVLPFAQPLYRIQVEGDAWQVSGVRDHQLQGRAISLKRSQPNPRSAAGNHSAESGAIRPLPAPPFVELERTLELGLEWRMHTRVRRVAPEQGPIALSIPLLPGESVTSDRVVVKEGAVKLNLAPSQRSLSWQSVLPITPELLLEAASNPRWVERWRVRPELRWHLNYAGLAPIRRPQQGSGGQLEWWPHQGESLRLKLSQPAALAGRHLTLDRVALEYKPGRRISDLKLELIARTSQGREWPLFLPQGAELDRLELNGTELLPNRQGEQLLIPLQPGENRIKLRWSQDQGYQVLTKSPVLDLGAAANVGVHIRMPAERWTLLVGGPAMGPAVLFWGVLLVVALVALVLGRQSWSPLRSWHWLLLGAGVASTQWWLLLVILAWFFLLWLRPQLAQSLWVQRARWRYNGLQVVLLLLTAAMLLSLLASVAMGLVFSEPAMQVAGNGSSAFYLNWYQDRVSAQLPEAWVLSVPMLAYRLLILVWSIWLSLALVRWLRWGWEHLSEGGFWMPKRLQVPDKPVKRSEPSDTQ